jgi:hypothetical protein
MVEYSGIFEVYLEVFSEKFEKKVGLVLQDEVGICSDDTKGVFYLLAVAIFLANASN